MNNKEQKFYNILQDLFVGAKLEGDSGYVNLMNIKTKQNSSFNANAFAVFGNRASRNISHGFFILRIEFSGNAVFQCLRVEQLCLLPERNFKMQPRRENFF